MDTLAGIAAELLALPPGEFTAARTARAKAASDREIARAITAIRKPTVAAWAVDALVRAHPGDIDRMLEVAAALREAQEDLDATAMRELSSRRRAVAGMLAATAVEVAAEAGVTVSASAREDVERTLNAGMLDAAAGEAVRSARLVRTLEAVGMEPVDLEGALAGGAPPLPAPVSRDELAPRRARKQAERAARVAAADASDAERALRKAEASLASARERADHAEERAAELRRELTRLDREAEAASTAVAACEQDVERAKRRHAEAADASKKAQAAIES